MNQKRILIVDDDHDVVSGTRLRLRAAGYSTIEAYDGEQGLAAAIENRPDAIVLDVRMPRMDGMTALAELRLRDDMRSIPVIVLSASLSDEQAALDAGARYFLPKPYQGGRLLAAVENVTNRDSNSCED
jgi:DNA-binding response OmpR family regulator